MITHTELLQARNQNGEGLFDCALATYAAQDAAMQLAKNWEAALRDGCKLKDLLVDVDEVIDNLRLWKDAVEHTFTNTLAEQA